MRKPAFRPAAIALAAAALIAASLLASTEIHDDAHAGALARGGQYSVAEGNQHGAGFEHQSIPSLSA